MRPLPALLLAALCATPAGARAEEPAPQQRIYRWVDENGVAHYTTDEERIPPSLRRRFGLPTQPLERKPIDAHAPAAEPPAPAPGEPSAGLDAWISEERGTLPDVGAPPAEPSAAPGAPEASEGTPPALAASAASPADRLAQLELRIAELSAAIAADEDALSAWIGDPAGGDPVALGQTPQFREIAGRLPKRIQELEALRRERDALESATP